MKTNQRGFVAPLLLLIIAAVLIGGGAYLYQGNSISILSSIGFDASQDNANQSITNTTADLKTISMLDLKVGDVLNVWRVESASVKSSSNGTLDSATVAFKGRTIISGKVWYSQMFDRTCVEVDEKTKMQIPRFKEDNRYSWFCFTDSGNLLPKELQNIGTSPNEGVPAVIEIADYKVVYAHTEASDTASFVRLVSTSPTSGNWSVYKNASRGFEINYPTELTAREIYTHNRVVCFDSTAKPFEICIDDGVMLAAGNETNVMKSLGLDALGTKLNATVNAAISGDMYSVDIRPKNVTANCGGKGTASCGNIVVTSKDKNLLQSMLLTLKFIP